MITHRIIFSINLFIFVICSQKAQALSTSKFIKQIAKWILTLQWRRQSFLEPNRAIWLNLIFFVSYKQIINGFYAILETRELTVIGVKLTTIDEIQFFHNNFIRKWF